MKLLHRILLLAGLVGLLASCGPIVAPPLGPPDTGSFTAAGQYVPKVDNFQVIMDSSQTMTEKDNKAFLTARDIVSRINQGIPTDLNYTGGLRVFGSNWQTDSSLVYGMTSYNRTDFHSGLAGVRQIGGPSPLAAALVAAGSDLPAAAKSAVIVVSDGLHMDDAPAAAESIKASHGGNLCIYTIAVGNAIHGAGQKLLQQVAAAGQCGFATTAEALADPAEMSSFIERVFLAPKPAVTKPAPKPAPPGDRDGDGVTDDKDKCPDSPPGALVDEVGCELKLTLNINFDHDKYDIKPDFKSDLDRAAAYIERYSHVPYIMIAGHTDRDGTVEYNQTLSENRANAVRDYLIDNYGIDGKRLFIKGFGKLKPVADNSTKEGRYQNRRVELICCAVKPF